MSSKYPHHVNDLPTEPYYAILHETSVYTPGDERSRTNPGHGYPASTDYYWNIEVYPDRESWLAEIKRLEERKNSFSKAYQAVEIKPAQIVTHIEVK